jgi:hypothetical protein
MTKEDIDKLLDKLNSLAMARDYYEYGLPEYDREEFYQAVREWFATVSQTADA